jgi:hypothetical protein
LRIATTPVPCDGSYFLVAPHSPWHTDCNTYLQSPEPPGIITRNDKKRGDTMNDMKKLEATMKQMAARLDINSNDEEARVIFDRCSELLVTIWKEEVS